MGIDSTLCSVCTAFIHKGYVLLNGSIQIVAPCAGDGFDHIFVFLALQDLLAFCLSFSKLFFGVGKGRI